MSVKTNSLTLFPLVLLTIFLSAPSSFASEWGCEVLLCSASSNPSWQGVPACHPPMNRLISEMKKMHFSWPTCEEAGTGAPGYERYLACPDGYKVGSSNDHNGFSRDGNLCVKTVNVCQNGTHGFFGSHNNGDGCIQTVTIPRPLRSEPYYFDIKNDTSGQNERHWFGLNR